MIRFVRFLFRRALILALVFALSYATIRIFPYLDRELPVWIAVLLTYGLVAYVGIPLAFRIFHWFAEPKHVPTYNTTVDGWPSDPINIAVLARNERDLIWAMRKAGWHTADEATVWNSLREAFALAFNKPYPTAPFSKLYLFGRKQDVGFQLPVGNSPRHRHHVRFWRVAHQTMLELRDHEHQSFWQKLFRKFWNPKLHLWVGAAIYDAKPVAIRWRNGQLTHQVDPNADKEREFIIDSLQQAGVLRTVTNIKAGEPYRKRGQTLGMTIISDGFVKLCELKHQILPPAARPAQPTTPRKSRR